MNLSSKKPFKSTHAWNWGTEDDKDPEDSDSDDMLLPPDIFARLKAKTTYPNCKMYRTEEEAFEDLRQAMKKLELES
jgi:hypothetical protein